MKNALMAHVQWRFELIIIDRLYQIAFDGKIRYGLTFWPIFCQEKRKNKMQRFNPGFWTKLEKLEIVCFYIFWLISECL